MIVSACSVVELSKILSLVNEWPHLTHTLNSNQTFVVTPASSTSNFIHFTSCQMPVIPVCDCSTIRLDSELATSHETLYLSPDAVVSRAKFEMARKAGARALITCNGVTSEVAGQHSRSK